MESREKSELLQVRLTTEEKEYLRQFASKHGVPVSEIVRRAVDTYIAQRIKRKSLLD